MSPCDKCFIILTLVPILALDEESEELSLKSYTLSFIRMSSVLYIAEANALAFIFIMQSDVAVYVHNVVSTFAVTDKFCDWLELVSIGTNLV